MTDEEFATFREELEEQRDEIHAALAEETGRNPEEYRRDRAVTDGGE